MSHPHSIYDTDPHFSIDPDTRVITNKSGTKPVIVQLDHNSERFTFELPRFIEEHDMSLCDSVQVHYINIGSKEQVADRHDLTDLQISPDSDDVVICSWLIPREATSLSGTLSFAISFSCSENGEVVYAWGTLPYKDITIGQGINNSNAIAKEYADILQQWEEDIYSRLSVMSTRLDNMERDTSTKLSNIENEFDKKVSRLDTSVNGNVVYVENASGTTGIPYATKPTRFTIPQRKGSGELLVRDNPTVDNEAVSKGYVDSAISTAIGEALEADY